MEGKETEREHVITMLRACLLSIKGGIPLPVLERDYKILVGNRIPYIQLGYQSLEKFLLSIPNVSMSRDRNGEIILDAIPNKSTEHLAALVSKQRTTPKKMKSIHPQRRTAATSWIPPPSSTLVRIPRRSSLTSNLAPLSVTVRNNTDNLKGRSFGKPSRLVSFATSIDSRSGSSGRSHSTYEKPPRFQKMTHSENTVCDSKSSNVTVSAETLSSSSLKSFTGYSVASSKAQERLQQIRPKPLQNTQEALPVSTQEIGRNENFNVNSSVMNRIESEGRALKGTNFMQIRNVESRTITSPLTPLHARLNAVLNLQKAKPMEEQTSRAANDSDYMKCLKEFALSKNKKEPEYKILPRQSGKELVYSSSVKIADFSISSYPDEKESPGEAMQTVAKLALKELCKIKYAPGGNETSDTTIIMERVSNIVKKHPSGIWSTQVPIDYLELFKESLPEDWLKIMSRCSSVSLDHAAGHRTILSPSLYVENSPTEPLICDTTPPPRTQSPGTQVRPMLSPIGIQVPEPITLPQNDAWDVHVTYGNSTDEIWIRLIGEDYNVKFENMVTNMEMFYMEKENICPNPEIGCIYAINMDDCWHRVELLDIRESREKGDVLFIDYGDTEVVLLKQLHILERRFVVLPAQAVCCYLWGLEDFAEDANADHHITNLLNGKTFVASIKTRPTQENPRFGIILYDTSTDDDLNINILLIENLSRDAMAPQLPMEGKVKEVFVSHVSDTGEVYLQFDSYNYVQSLVTNVIESGVKRDMILSNSQNISTNPNQLYLAKYTDDNWYRATITKKLEKQNEVLVFFIDFGNFGTVNTNDMIVLDKFKRAIVQMPYQAVKVHLHDVPVSSFNERMIARLRKIIPFNERVLVKTKNSTSARNSSNVPTVEIFKRLEGDNLLVSINNTIALDSELKFAKPANEDNSNLRGKKRLERLQSITLISGANYSTDGSGENDLLNLSPLDTSLRGLSPPQIPEIGQYFDVNVTMAANPGNFTVQPYNDALHLSQMMEKMQLEYKQQKYSPVTPEVVQEGGLYAALHSDGSWYRVCVTNVISGNMVSVYFCDYGDVSVLPVDKLQPLVNQFKELPYQAIKAKLAGVQPKHSDWSVEDCLMFQELVVERQFVSIVMETGPDLLNPSDTVIGLKLIDTSKDKDVYIDKLLIEQERAISTSGAS